MESDLPPLTQRLSELTLLHGDKWCQLQPNDPRREMITGNVAFRIRRTGWRELVRPEVRRVGPDAQPSQSNSAPSPPPWIVPPAVPTFKMDGTTICGAGLCIMAEGTIIPRWHALTGALSSSFQAEKTVMQAAIA